MSDEDGDLSLCPACYCMTRRVDGKCGKCGAWSATPGPDDGSLGLGITRDNSGTNNLDAFAKALDESLAYLDDPTP